MENIDFLQEFKKKKKIKEKYSPFIKKGFLFFAFLYLLTVFTVFFFFLYYNQESKKVSFLIEEKKNRIKQLEKRESLQVLIKQRISFLSKIINSRKIDFVNKVAYLASLEEKNNIIFKKIEFKENGVVLVSGTTSDVKIFRNFLKNLENDSYFDQIDVDSIKRGKDGSYDFSLSLGKNEEKNSPNNIQEIIKKYSFLLIVFLMVFSFLFLIKPKITQILEIRKKIENDKKTLKFLTEKTFLLESLNEADLISRSEKILKVLPEEINLPLVLGNIRAIANNEGVNISRINVNLTSDKKEELKVIGFDLTIQGNKEGIKNFLKEIEESAPLMDIKSLRIEVVDKNEEVNLKLDTYYLTLPKTLGKIDAPVVLLTEQEEKLYQDLSRFSQKFFMGEGGFEITSDQIGKENPFSF